MKTEKIFKYRYPFKKEYLLIKLNNRTGFGHNWNRGEYLIDIKNENCFHLGVGRAGHSSGYWYIGNIEEDEEGTIISGKIVFNPDENGNELKKPAIDLVEIFFYIIFSPFIIILKIKNLVRTKIKKLSEPVPKTEENLENFMVNYLCCIRIENN